MTDLINAYIDKRIKDVGNHNNKLVGLFDRDLNKQEIRRVHNLFLEALGKI